MNSNIEILKFLAISILAGIGISISFVLITVLISMCITMFGGGV